MAITATSSSSMVVLDWIRTRSESPETTSIVPPRSWPSADPRHVIPRSTPGAVAVYLSVVHRGPEAGSARWVATRCEGVAAWQTLESDDHRCHAAGLGPHSGAVASPIWRVGVGGPSGWASGAGGKTGAGLCSGAAGKARPQQARLPDLFHTVASGDQLGNAGPVSRRPQAFGNQRAAA